jgi:preprotein translocase subunit SecY
VTIRRLLVTVGALFLYRLGGQIPLPGLNQDTLWHLGISTNTFSIFALGVTPFFSVLIVVEFATAIIPAFARWRMVDRSNEKRLKRYTFLAALIMAAAQANAVANGFEKVSGLVDDPGWMFRIGIVGTIVGATVVLGWLADGISMHGLGNGFWLLLVAPQLIKLTPVVLGGIERWRVGYLSAGALIGIVAYFVLGIAALVAISMSRYRRRVDFGNLHHASQIDEMDFVDVWPPILANYVGGFVTVAGMLFLQSGKKFIDGSLSITSLIHILIIAVLLAVFTYLRNRNLYTIAAATHSDTGRVRELVWMLALTQIIICATGELLTNSLGLPISGMWLIIVVAVSLNCFTSISSKEPTGYKTVASE